MITSSANAHGNNASYLNGDATVSPLRAEAIAAVASVASRAALLAAVICLYVVLARPDLAAIIVFVCATLSSIAGFAFSAISGPMLLHATADPVKAVHIMLVASIALQSYSVWALRKSINLRELLPYFAGGLSTVMPGVYLLLHTPTAIYLLALGAFLTAYASYMLVRPAIRLESNSLAGRVFVGALGGITGATAAFPGRLCYDLVRRACLGQAPATRHLSALHPRHAMRDVDGFGFCLTKRRNAP